MKKISVFVLLFVWMLSSGCSTLSESTMLGVTVGGTAGAIIGSGFSQNESSKSSLLGAAIGAAAGGLIGYYGHKQKEERLRTNAFKIDVVKPSIVPNLLMPTVRKVWSPDKISEDGRRFEAGHWIFFIERPSSWSQP